MVYFPIVDHGAELLHRTVKECLLLCAKAGRLDRLQLGPIRITGEKLRLPPDFAGGERFAFGLGQRGQGFLGPTVYWFGEQVGAQVFHGSPLHQANALHILSVPNGSQRQVVSNAPLPRVWSAPRLWLWCPQ